jgi:hypothetical protein
MKDYLKITLLLLFIIAVFYFAKLKENHYISNFEKQIHLQKQNYPYIKTIGNNSSKGNLIALSIDIQPKDFSSEEVFYKKLEQYFEILREKNLIEEETSVILPEHIGTFLFLLNEKKFIYEEKELSQAVESILNSNLYLKLNSKFKKEKTNIKFLLKYKSKKMFEVYKNTFSRLASLYKVKIFAGSIVIPEVNLQKKETFIDTELKNISFVFSKEGKISDYSIKSKLSEFEVKTLGLFDSKEKKSLSEKNITFLLSNDFLELNTETDILISPSSLFIQSNEKERESIEGLFTENNKNFVKSRIIAQFFLKGKMFDYDLQGKDYYLLRYSLEEKNNKNLPWIVNIWL